MIGEKRKNSNLLFNGVKNRESFIETQHEKTVQKEIIDTTKFQELVQTNKIYPIKGYCKPPSFWTACLMIFIISCTAFF